MSQAVAWPLARVTESRKSCLGVCVSVPPSLPQGFQSGVHFLEVVGEPKRHWLVKTRVLDSCDTLEDKARRQSISGLSGRCQRGTPGKAQKDGVSDCNLAQRPFSLPRSWKACLGPACHTFLGFLAAEPCRLQRL